MSKFGVCVLNLGYTRLAGLTVYDSATREFVETKPKAARQMIEKGILYGVKWDKEKEYFAPDPDFNMKDLLIKSGVGNYRSLLFEVAGEVPGTAYIVVRVLNTNAGRLYEVINNRCQRVKLTEAQLRGLGCFGNIAGVRIKEDEIEICKGVVIEDRVYPENAQFVSLPLNVDGAMHVMNQDEKEPAEEPAVEKEAETSEEVDEQVPEESEQVKEEVETPAEVEETVDEEEKPTEEEPAVETEEETAEEVVEEVVAESLEEVFGVPATKGGKSKKRGSKK